LRGVSLSFGSPGKDCLHSGARERTSENFGKLGTKTAYRMFSKKETEKTGPTNLQMTSGKRRKRGTASKAACGEKGEAVILGGGPGKPKNLEKRYGREGVEVPNRENSPSSLPDKRPANREERSPQKARGSSDESAMQRGRQGWPSVRHRRGVNKLVPMKKGVSGSFDQPEQGEMKQLFRR